MACTPHLLSYNVNSLSYYTTSESGLRRKGQILDALGAFIKEADIICLQETNLAPSEKFALTHLPGCTIAHNNFDIGQAGTLIIDTPRVNKFFTGSDVSLPPAVRGHIQLRRYTPKDPARSPFQVFNFYLKSGSDFSAKEKLLTSLLEARPPLEEGSLPTFVCGDLNFVESVDDTTSANPRLPTAEFSKVWENFKDRFGLSEVAHDAHTYFHYTADPTSPYSRSSRLDRVLVPSALASHPLFSPAVNIPHHLTNFSVGRRTTRDCFSDHLPIRLSFLGEALRAPGRPTIPQWLAESPTFEKTLREKWKPELAGTGFAALEKFKEILHKAAHAARAVKITNNTLSLRLSHHQALLRRVLSPDQDFASIHRLLNLDPPLQKLVVFKSGRWVPNGLEDATRDLVVQASPSEEKPRTNPLRALAEKIPNTRTQVGTLRLSPDAPPASTGPERSTLAKEFWSKVWEKRSPPISPRVRENFLNGKNLEGPSPTDPRLKDVFLGGYDREVEECPTPDINAITQAIKLSNNSSPGPDGISFAAWRAAPDLAAPVLHNVLQAIMMGHTPPDGFNHGLLFLLLKNSPASSPTPAPLASLTPTIGS
jgi:exonuclease III